MYSKDERFVQVQARIASLQKEYPEMYIGLWCPEDFEQAIDQVNLPIPTGDELYDVSCAMVESLHDHHDADAGVNWHIIRWTAEDVLKQRIEDKQ
jgi:hypothetical protein